MKIFRPSVILPLLLAAAAPRVVLAGLSAPHTSVTRQQPQAAAPAIIPQIDDDAMALLKNSQAVMLSLKTYRAESEMTMNIEHSGEAAAHQEVKTATTMIASKPNLLRLETNTLTADASGALTVKPENPGVIMLSDGKDLVTQSGKTYRTTPLKSLAQLPSAGGTADGFFRSETSLYGQVETAIKRGSLVAVRSMGSEVVNGVDCKKVLIDTTVKAPNEFEEKQTYFFGPDGLVRRTMSVMMSKQLNYTVERTVTSLKTDEPIANAATLFAYTPPAGVTLFVPKPPPVLLANGVAAPDFTAVDSTGATVKLSDFKGKVVVVDFWASWCPPCKASMPHNQEVTKKLQAAGVPMVLLAVDNSEDQPAFAKWVHAHPEMASLRFVYADPLKHKVCGDDYHVSGIPTQYVIDPNGIIRASFVGYDSPNDDMENAVKAALVKTASK